MTDKQAKQINLTVNVGGDSLLNRCNFYIVLPKDGDSKEMTIQELTKLSRPYVNHEEIVQDAIPVYCEDIQDTEEIEYAELIGSEKRYLVPVFVLDGYCDRTVSNAKTKLGYFELFENESVCKLLERLGTISGVRISTHVCRGSSSMSDSDGRPLKEWVGYSVEDQESQERINEFVKSRSIELDMFGETDKQVEEYKKKGYHRTYCWGPGRTMKPSVAEAAQVLGLNVSFRNIERIPCLSICDWDVKGVKEKGNIIPYEDVKELLDEYGIEEDAMPVETPLWKNRKKDSSSGMIGIRTA